MRPDEVRLRPTWGLIVSDSRSFFSRAWGLGVFPGMAIMITVLSINFLGEALRDILDVRNQTRTVSRGCGKCPVLRAKGKVPGGTV